MTNTPDTAEPSSPVRIPAGPVPGDGLVLRPLNAADVDDIVRACQDPATQRYLVHLPVPYTRADAEDFVTVQAASAWSGGRAEWAITAARDDRYLGSLGVPRVDWRAGVAELGYQVAPWARGRRLAARALTVATEFVFAQGIQRAELYIAPDNIPSQRTALLAGFRREAQLRSAFADRNGHRVSRLVYSRVPGDPPGPTPRLLSDLPPEGLSDGVIGLRPRQPCDIDALDELAGRDEVWTRNVPPNRPSRESIEASCRFGAQANWLDDVQAAMVITDAETGGFLGEIALQVMNPEMAEAMLSYALAPHARGGGRATRAVRLISQWGFDIGFQRLFAGTAVDNIASQRVLARAGFTREGIERSRLPSLGGTRVDNVAWSLLPQDKTWTS